MSNTWWYLPTGNRDDWCGVDGKQTASRRGDRLSGSRRSTRTYRHRSVHYNKLLVSLSGLFLDISQRRSPFLVEFQSFFDCII